MKNTNETIERVVYNIITDSKVKKHKFNVGYDYEVNTKNLSQIVTILLKFNMDISIILKNDTSIITIFHLPSGKKGSFRITCDDNNLKNVFLYNIKNFKDSEELVYITDKVIHYLKFNGK